MSFHGEVYLLCVSLYPPPHLKEWDLFPLPFQLSAPLNCFKTCWLNSGVLHPSTLTPPTASPESPCWIPFRFFITWHNPGPYHLLQLLSSMQPARAPTAHSSFLTSTLILSFCSLAMYIQLIYAAPQITTAAQVQPSRIKLELFNNSFSLSCSCFLHCLWTLVSVTPSSCIVPQSCLISLQQIILVLSCWQLAKIHYSTQSSKHWSPPRPNTPPATYLSASIRSQLFSWQPLLGQHKTR